MQSIVRLNDTISRYGVWVSGALLFFASFLIAVEVLLRKLFSVSMGGADEISSYVLAVSTAWSLSFALYRKAHIRIDVAYMRLPVKVRPVFDILALSMLAGYISTLAWFAVIVFTTSFQRGATANTPLRTPLWIPQFLWALGLLFFLLSITILISGYIERLAARDIDGALRLGGASTLDDEIGEEIGEGVAERTSAEPRKAAS